MDTMENEGEEDENTQLKKDMMTILQKCKSIRELSETGNELLQLLREC